MQRNHPPFSLPERSDTNALARKQFSRFVSDFHQNLIFQRLSRLGMSECAFHEKRARGRWESLWFALRRVEFQHVPADRTGTGTLKNVRFTVRADARVAG